MQPWHVTLESILMLLLWIVNAVGDMVVCILLIIVHDHGGWIMLIILGLWHFLINAWVIRLQRKNINKCGLVMLGITQTAALYMLCRRAWRSLVPCCANDIRSKKRKALIAKYSLCCQSWSSTQKFPTTDGDGLQKGSCIPLDLVPSSNPISTTVSNSSIENGSTPENIVDQIFNDDEHVQQVIPMSSTKFVQDTFDIELNFNAPEEVYIGEPNLLKFVVRALQMLFVDEKKLSYHIVTDSKNTILYATKSDRHIRNLPPRVVPGNSLTFCSDIHYALNLTKTVGYEVFAATKRTFEENSFLVETDLSKFLWSLVWPSAIIKLYTLFDQYESSPAAFPTLTFLSPAFSIITWLVTQKGVSEPWRNTAILILLRILMTVPRALLVIGISTGRSIVLAALCYISAKVTGVISLTAHLIYAKKHRNIELYSDDIDKYNFNPNLEPVIQICESVVYMLWAIWWYVVSPRSELGKRYNVHFPLIFLLTTILFHVIGLTWLFFARDLLRKPFKDPRSVLRQIQSLEYIKT